MADHDRKMTSITKSFYNPDKDTFLFDYLINPFVNREGDLNALYVFSSRLNLL